MTPQEPTTPAGDPSGWTEGFDDLADRMDQVILCEGVVSFCINEGALEDGTPGLVIRLNLPDGRVALGGIDLLDILADLNMATLTAGWGLALRSPSEYLAEHYPGDSTPAV